MCKEVNDDVQERAACAAAARRAETTSPEWNGILEALEQLYNVWARNGDNAPETSAALNDLMARYDRFLG